MISELIDLVVSSIKYIGLYNEIKEVDEKLCESIDKQAEFAKWNKVNAISKMLTETSKKITTLLPDEFTNNYAVEVKETEKDIQLLMDIIEDKLCLFEEYEK